jgi:hypothetical protein
MLAYLHSCALAFAYPIYVWINIRVWKTKLEIVLLKFLVPSGFPPYSASSATIEDNSICVLTIALLLGFVEEQLRQNSYGVRASGNFVSQTAYRRIFPLKKKSFSRERSGCAEVAVLTDVWKV